METVPTFDEFIAREVEAKIACQYVQSGEATGWSFGFDADDIRWYYFSKTKDGAWRPGGTYWYVSRKMRKVYLMRLFGT